MRPHMKRWLTLGGLLLAGLLALVQATTALALVQPTTALAVSPPARPSAPQPTAAYTPEFNVKDYGAKGNGSGQRQRRHRQGDHRGRRRGRRHRPVPLRHLQVGEHDPPEEQRRRSSSTPARRSPGSSADSYDAPESNPYDQYQDYGHSHFHDAMFYGDRLTNIGFTGSGTIDGGGNLITGNPKSGQADKILSLTRCDGLTLGGGSAAPRRPLRGAHQRLHERHLGRADGSTRRATATAGTSSARRTSPSPTPTSRPTTTRWCSRATTRSARNCRTGTSPSHGSQTVGASAATR